MTAEPRFRPRDLLTLLAIFALGGIGYLCDAQSALVVPFLWIFGLAFTTALLVLVAAIFRDAFIRRSPGWQAGLLLLALPLIAWAVYRLGLLLFSLL